MFQGPLSEKAFLSAKARAFAIETLDLAFRIPAVYLYNILLLF